MSFCPLFSRGGTAAGLRARPEKEGVNRMGWKLVHLAPFSTHITIYNYLKLRFLPKLLLFTVLN